MMEIFLYKVSSAKGEVEVLCTSLKSGQDLAQSVVKAATLEAGSLVTFL